jgi:hypothetical protein
MVDVEDTEDASLSLPAPITVLNIVDAVELCLFFLGMGGKILPGNSVLSFLCSR